MYVCDLLIFLKSSTREMNLIKKTTNKSELPMRSEQTKLISVYSEIYKDTLAGVAGESVAP